MISQLFTAGPFWSNPLLQSTVCVTAGLIASLLLRRRSARAHQVLLLAMIASVAVPAMSMIVRHYELGIFVDKPAVTKSQFAEIPIVPIIIEYEKSPLSVIPNAYYTEAIEREYSIPAAAFTSEAKTKLPLRTILMWSWIIVSTILAFRLLVTFILGLGTLRRAFPLHCDKLEKALLIAKGKLGIDKPVEVLAGSTISSPVIWCWSRRPALLVPEDSEQFEDGVDWVGMFCHELAHWSRLDHISGLFSELIVCVFPWHPLMWLARRRLAGLSEQACDDWVVAGSRCPADYAESLLDLSPQGQLFFLPAVVGRKNGLENRVRRIIKDKCGKPDLGLCWAVVVTLIAACITIGAAFAQTRPADIDEVKDECEELTTKEKQQLRLDKKQLALLITQKDLKQPASELKVQQIQRDNLMLFKNELQTLKDRTRQQLDGLPKEVDKLRDKLKEIEDMIRNIDSRLLNMRLQQKLVDDSHTEQETAQHQEPAAERRAFVAERQALQLLAQQIEGKLKAAPEREDAEKLKERLKEYGKRIREIDSELSSSEWCPEKRKAEQLKKPKIPTDVGSLIEKQKSDTSCSSCHADIDHIKVHRKSRDVEAAKAELKNREAEWLAEMRAFETDVVTANQKTIDANKQLNNDLATLEKTEQDIKIFTIENRANFETDIVLHNKLKTMIANRDRLAEKIERDNRVLTKYQEELKAAEERRDEYLKYKPTSGTEFNLDYSTPKRKTKEPVKEDKWHTKPPSQQGQPRSLLQPDEKLQGRINQLQDEIGRLRSEITELRKLMKDMVDYEKNRPKPSLFEINKDPTESEENRRKKSLPEIHRYPLEPGKKQPEKPLPEIHVEQPGTEKIEGGPRGKKLQEHPPDDISNEPGKIETIESKTSAD